MHLVQTMAYVGQEPWHGLGQKLTPRQPLAVWAKAAGMDWRINEAEVRYVAGNGDSTLGSIHAFPEQKVLYRSDTPKRIRESTSCCSAQPYQRSGQTHSGRREQVRPQPAQQ